MFFKFSVVYDLQIQDEKEGFWIVSRIGGNDGENMRNICRTNKDIFLFIHGQDSLLMSGTILGNIKNMYSEIMEFEEVPGAAHHVPLDKPKEIIDIIKGRLF